MAVLLFFGISIVGAAIGRPCGRQYGFALGFGEFADIAARTSDARPYDFEISL